MGKVRIGSAQLQNKQLETQFQNKQLEVKQDYSMFQGGQDMMQNYTQQLETKIVYVDRPVIVEKLVEVEKEVVKYVDKEVEVVKNVVQEVVRYVDREVEKIIEKPVEVIRLQFQKVSEMPLWGFWIMALEAVVIIGLLLK